MTTAIRYYSKFGHTEKMVNVIRELTGATPQKVDIPLDEPVDTLYLGCGVFLGKIDGSVVDFIKGLTPDKVRRVICFGSCAIIKSPVPQMRDLLLKQGITLAEEEFTCRGSMGPLHSGHPNETDMAEFRKFIQGTL
ncbi:MAG: hypothetical protein IJ764_00960 [Bacteroidales bacterium]|nr:hypothetical protein [Bacteroidales bacterium]